MAELPRIAERAKSWSPPRLQAFLELGFRPLYLAGSFWAAISIALWIYAPGWLSATMTGVFWRALEMLWGFIATIAVGFLLIAAATWTGLNPLRALPDLSIPMHASSGQWQLGTGVLSIVFALSQWPVAAGFALPVTGAIALAQVLAWKPWAVRRQPLLWILYLGYSALGAGLLVAAARTWGWVLRDAWPAHVIGAAGLSVLVIGMVTCTALGHLGRPLRADRAMVMCYALVIAAAALRTVALPPTVLATVALHASSVAWVLAFAIYTWRFFPLMIRPRSDSPLPTPAPSVAR